MYGDGFRKLFWGFLFILVDFRIQGFDILPDIVGFILFAMGFSALVSASEFFVKAQNFNYPMIFLSIFQIYERPAQAGEIHYSPLGPLGLLIGIASLILTLLVVYNLFAGIKDMAHQRDQLGLADEAGTRWSQFLALQIAVLLAFIVMFIPGLNLLYIIGLIIASIVLTVVIMGFMKRCEERLHA